MTAVFYMLFMENYNLIKGGIFDLINSYNTVVDRDEVLKCRVLFVP